MQLWEPNTTIELLALLLTIPGSIVAMLALNVLLKRRRDQHEGMLLFQQHFIFFSL